MWRHLPIHLGIGPVKVSSLPVSVAADESVDMDGRGWDSEASAEPPGLPSRWKLPALAKSHPGPIYGYSPLYFSTYLQFSMS
jgi:hypothetical protein